MLYLMSKYESLKSDRRGVTALEYAVVAAVIIGVVATAIGGFGSTIANKINDIGTTLNSL